MIDNNTNDLISSFLSIRSQLNNTENVDSNIELQKLISVSILNNIILSKKIFKKNFMIERFLDKKFGIKLSKYAFTSRTMICGKITKYVYMIDDDELINFLNALYSVIMNLKNNKDIFDGDIYDVIMGMEL